MQPDGSYERSGAARDTEPVNCQEWLLERAGKEPSQLMEGGRDGRPGWRPASAAWTGNWCARCWSSTFPCGSKMKHENPR